MDVHAVVNHMTCMEGIVNMLQLTAFCDAFIMPHASVSAQQSWAPGALISGISRNTWCEHGRNPKAKDHTSSMLPSSKASSGPSGKESIFMPQQNRMQDICCSCSDPANRPVCMGQSHWSCASLHFQLVGLQACCQRRTGHMLLPSSKPRAELTPPRKPLVARSCPTASTSFITS